MDLPERVTQFEIRLQFLFHEYAEIYGKPEENDNLARGYSENRANYVRERLKQEYPDALALYWESRCATFQIFKEPRPPSKEEIERKEFLDRCKKRGFWLEKNMQKFIKSYGSIIDSEERCKKLTEIAKVIKNELIMVEDKKIRQYWIDRIHGKTHGLLDFSSLYQLRGH